MILFVGIFSVVLVVAAIVVDFGLWFAERRADQRAVDLAAAAGAQDLPLSPGAAYASACSIGTKNGFAQADLTVEIFKKGSAPGTPRTCGQATPVPACNPNCDRVRVRASDDGPLLFSGALGLGITSPEIGAQAAAGLTYSGGGGAGGVGPAQTIVLLDATGRMGQTYFGGNCSGNPTQCPITMARAATKQLVARLLGVSTGGQVAYAAHHNCYSSTPGPVPGTGCVNSNSMVVGFSSGSSANLNAAIDATLSYQIQAANVCTPLAQAKALFNQQPSSGHKVVVLLSDGDNLDYDSFNEAGAPPAGCFPSPGVPVGSNPLPCSATRTGEAKLDNLTQQMANQLKNQGVEIYVVGLNPCPRASNLQAPPVNIPWQPSDCGTIVATHTIHDNTMDQRLLMCIATDADHYTRVNNVSQLPDVLDDIASEIVSRSLLQ